MSRRYYVILPSIPGSIEDEWKQCLDKILDKRNSGLTPVKINVFADLPDFESLKAVKDSIIDSAAGVFHPVCPAINVTAQPPEEPYKIAVEVTFIVTETADVTGREYNSIPYLIIESKKGKELIAGGLSSYMYSDDTRTAAEMAFDIILALLERENMSVNDIVRQWNYIGNILQVRNDLQNYQIFNEVRSEYYHRFRSVKNFPAATGVGMKHGGVIIDICAIQPEKCVTIIPVENPNQVNAWQYGQNVLKGNSDKGKPVKNPPQFERGLLLANQSHYTLFISGTASIKGQETIGTGDVEKQTIVTIENIRKLSDPGRINELVPARGIHKERFGLLRTYIKKQSDFGPVRQICEKFFPGIPVSYVEADICRDDLLVEIEGEAEMN